MAASHAADREEHARAAALASRAWQVGEKHPRVLGSVALELALVAALGADAAQARRALGHVNGPLVEEYAKLWVEAEVAALDGLADESRAKACASIAALGRARIMRPSARDRERLQWLAAHGASQSSRA
jgi:hypothetical protein